MAELVGNAMLLLGGVSLSAASITLARAQRSSVERARELLGNSDQAVPLDTPPDMQALLARLG